MTELDLVTLRRAYARHIAFAARSDDPRLEQALFDVRREAFMGDGPWLLGAGGPPRRTPDAEPHWLYQDVLVSLVAEKSLNNGQPSFLAFLISLGAIQSGDHVVHIGAGVGYYTAIMAELAGPGGHVAAIELEPELAARAAANLAPWPQVEVACADGSLHPLAPTDVILVNAGASRPLDLWLGALKDGGRLILPLCIGYALPDGTPMTRGHIFLIERHGGDFAATWKSPTAIYPCFGAQDAASEASLKAALSRGGQDKVRRLVRTADLPADVPGDVPGDIPGDACWARGPGWALTFE
jgi:protein-L-isoaspartate(D-aspartate) O-methyltransferase